MPQKMFEVIKRTTKNIRGVRSSKRELNFGKQGAFHLYDAGEAREIDSVYGRGGSEDVLVIPVDRPYEGTGKRYHTVPELPWKRGK
jgi:hypothetical protein